MGAPLSAIARWLPSRATRTVWLASPTTRPDRNTLATGSSQCWPVSSSMIEKTSARGLPAASSCGQPVNSSATPLMRTIRPWVSVAITPSPIERRVTRRRSVWPASTASVRRSSEIVAVW